MLKRTLGDSPLRVSTVGMGCWPISGMTSLDVTREHSEATLRTAFDQGINFFDTAHCYGANGESESLLGDVLRPIRDRCILATKAGIHWGPNGHASWTPHLPAYGRNAKPVCSGYKQKRSTCSTCMRPTGKHRFVNQPKRFGDCSKRERPVSWALSNLTLNQLQDFHEVCPVIAVQPPYNMLLRQIETDLIPWCRSHQISVVPYWPLMKGLLAGKLTRDHQFLPGDGRPKYGATSRRRMGKEPNLCWTSCGSSPATAVIAWPNWS